MSPRPMKFMWIRALKNSPFAALAMGLMIGAVFSSASVKAQEASPNDIAKALGLPEEEGDDFAPNFGFSKDVPQTRTLTPDQFKNFRLNVDIFRRSAKNPVLRGFREEFVPALVPVTTGMTADQVLVEAKKRFALLAAKEFAIVSIDGVPVKANIVSGALEQYIDEPVKGADGKNVIDPTTGRVVTRRSLKSTPPGNYRLDALSEQMTLRGADGILAKQTVANPWIRSHTYDNSQMFWAVWIKGGYFIHSTPHYGELGQPASMGCMRQSFPDAMELFAHMVQENLTGMIRIGQSGSDASVSRLREVIYDAGFDAAPKAALPLDNTKDMNWLLGQLYTSYVRIRDATAYFGTDVEIKGHAWLDPTTKKPAPTMWPICGAEGSGIDCFKPWGVKKPANSVN